MPSILVVDDSPMDRKIVCDILESDKMTVRFAENGEEALARIAENRPDIVLTDLQMPVMDGLALVRNVKRLYPATPVILMTRQGSEETAVEALRVGAASYVPKRNLQRDLGRALEVVLSAVESRRERAAVLGLLQSSQSTYVLGYETRGATALVRHLQESLAQLGLCNEIDRLRVGTALAEALNNAVDHGNLELDSELRESDLAAYRRLGEERSQRDPYQLRRVFVTATMTPNEATFIVRDEGPGFDPNQLPDPTNPENLIKPGGRGVMLIRTFMDEVHFNDRGNEITMVKHHRDENGTN